MKEIRSKYPQPSVRELLSYATSIEKVDAVYDQYIQHADKHLFAFVKDKKVIGCIGVEINVNHCEIKHIAVSPEERGKGIASKMIKFLFEKYNLTTIIAETDREAVQFYRKIGFTVTSLGEKYPGVERFFCEFTTN
ncbi:MAG: GNAT family N-acetyltransferase [Bacillaceae bacterium]|nr:GNAT family N-acetyltransferase [Bacillaceae bacterium]